MKNRIILYCLLTLVIGFCLGYGIYYAMNLESAQHNPNWDLPPTLSEQPKNLVQLMDDLDSIGCLVIKDVYQFGHYGNIIRIENYLEFRRVAFNTKIVFYKNMTDSYEDYLYTILDGVLISYHPPT